MSIKLIQNMILKVNFLKLDLALQIWLPNWFFNMPEMIAMSL